MPRARMDRLRSGRLWKLRVTPERNRSIRRNALDSAHLQGFLSLD